VVSANSSICSDFIIGDALAMSPLSPEEGAPLYVPARLRRDDDLVAVASEVLAEDLPEGLLGRAVRRAVVVREVELRDPELERAADDLA
jgi:hypothetical protein